MLEFKFELKSQQKTVHMNIDFPIDEEIDFSDFFIETPEKKKDKTPKKPQINIDML